MLDRSLEVLRDSSASAYHGLRTKFHARMPPPVSGYEFDVFFSYKRHYLSADWTRRVAALFNYYLSHELNVPEARVFVDQESIELGDEWPETLQRALRRSKCLVCVWSPLYFQSDWCYSEWRSFQARERLLAEGEPGD